MLASHASDAACEDAPSEGAPGPPPVAVSGGTVGSSAPTSMRPTLCAARLARTSAFSSASAASLPSLSNHISADGCRLLSKVRFRLGLSKGSGRGRGRTRWRDGGEQARCRFDT